MSLLELPIPRCHCGKKTEYRKNKEGNYYPARCSLKCRSLDKEFCKKISKIKISLYQDPEWKEKTENKKRLTTFQNYGVEYPMQNILVFEKQQAACFEKDENGLHGYEPFVYGFLKQLYPCIQNGTQYLKDNNLFIKWLGEDNKQHRSYPDFFCSEVNLFIEIKSEYTRKLHHEKLMKCKDALHDMKYGYGICVVNPNKSYAIEMYNLEFIEG
jgi:hypothetical protein